MYKYRSALVLGCGRSGKAADALLRSEGADTLVLDESNCDFSSFKFQVSSFQPQVAIISPGFSLEHSWVNELMARGIPLLSELEFGWSRRHCPVIAVTGSNGKSTVVKWIADALAEAGLKGIPCGNYGFPVSAAVMLPERPDWLVIEVSSFQLETVRAFRPEMGLLLNVLPNHLDRHGDMETYRNLKLRLFENMTEDDLAVIAPEFLHYLNPKQRESAFFTSKKNNLGEWQQTFPNCGKITFGIEEGSDYRFHHGRVGKVDFRETYFDNEVLGAAAAAVTAVCERIGISHAALERSAREFKPLSHRMETVAELNGVTFIDDSKATNLAGMCAALQRTSGRVHLIAGGRAKEIKLSFAKDLLVQKVSRLYLIGEASKAMQAAWGNSTICLSCGRLEAAVSAAWESAMPGDTVLLSPACTSFDQFRNFNERGEVFVHEVSRLKSESEKTVG